MQESHDDISDKRFFLKTPAIKIFDDLLEIKTDTSFFSENELNDDEDDFLDQ